MLDAAMRAVAPWRRLYLRIYLALLASLLLAASLFGIAHLYVDPARLNLAIMGRNRHALGFVVLLAVIALAVAVCAYPLVRRLTSRLERLQAGVDAWGTGQLGMRVPVEGKDEVASLAASFNEAAAHIQALVASQKSLLSNASHELRSPLARIRMASELIAEGTAPAIRAELLRNVAELDGLVEEILLASRLDAAAPALPRFEPVDLGGIAAEECARARAELQTGAQQVMGDAKLLRRLVRNLLENAARHGAGSPVAVRLSEEPDGIHLEVRDSGPGIPEAERERIFEPFYRIPGASEAAGGVGLGLSLVRQIARHHGGEVRCLPSDAGGRFLVTLPCQPG